MFRPDPDAEKIVPELAQQLPSNPGLHGAGRSPKATAPYSRITPIPTAIERGESENWPELRPRPLSYFRDIPLPEFLIDRFLPEGFIGIIAGAPFSGKSWFAIAMLSALASGRAFLGKFSVSRQCRVLYVPGEGQYTIAARFDALLDQYGLPADQRDQWVMSTQSIPHLLDCKQVGVFVNYILEVCKEVGSFDVICFDTLSQSIPGQDTNCVAVMTNLVEAVKRIQRELKQLWGKQPACLLLHHTTKGDPMNPSGSIQLGGNTDFTYIVSKVKEGINQFDVHELKNRANGGREWKPVKCISRPVNSENPYAGIVELREDRSSRVPTSIDDSLFDALRALAPSSDYPGVSVNELAAWAEATPEQIRGAIRRAHEKPENVLGRRWGQKQGRRPGSSGWAYFLDPDGVMSHKDRWQIEKDVGLSAP